MIDIVIVNWNSGVQLLDSVMSIAVSEVAIVSNLVIVDNSSSDDSLQRVDALIGELPFPIKIIKNKTNLGFGAACNLGARCCSSKYLLFLNPDTRLFENSLSVPFSYMEQPCNSNIGVCGIRLIDEMGHVARTCSRFPSVVAFAVQALGVNKLHWFRVLGQHMHEWGHDANRDVDQVIGAFFFTRRTLFEELDGFDERFFVYFEEVDFSYRARQAGWRSVYLADAQAFHAGGGTSQQVKAARLFYSLRSRLLYGFKHFSPMRAWALVGVTLLIEPVSRLVFSMLRGGLADVRNTLKGYGMLWRALPSILKVSRV